MFTKGVGVGRLPGGGAVPAEISCDRKRCRKKTQVHEKSTRKHTDLACGTKTEQGKDATIAQLIVIPYLVHTQKSNHNKKRDIFYSSGHGGSVGVVPRPGAYLQTRTYITSSVCTVGDWHSSLWTASEWWKGCGRSAWLLYSLSSGFHFVINLLLCDKTKQKKHKLLQVFATCELFTNQLRGRSRVHSCRCVVGSGDASNSGSVLVSMLL